MPKFVKFATKIQLSEKAVYKFANLNVMNKLRLVSIQTIIQIQKLVKHFGTVKFKVYCFKIMFDNFTKPFCSKQNLQHCLHSQTKHLSFQTFLKTSYFSRIVLKAPPTKPLLLKVHKLNQLACKNRETFQKSPRNTQLSHRNFFALTQSESQRLIICTQHDNNSLDFNWTGAKKQLPLVRVSEHKERKTRNMFRRERV